MRIQSHTLDYPPRRHIGSELFTHTLNKALAVEHEVLASTDSPKSNPGYDGIPVAPFRHSPKDWADLYLTHADFAGPAIGRKRPVVGICHNVEAGVLLSIHTNPFSLVVCNSNAMRTVLEQRDPQRYLVVHPPATAVAQRSAGDLVTIVNLNKNKVGLFWEIARALPEQGFLAVMGGYGPQVVPAVVPSNVEVVDHVPHGQMWERCWSRTRLLLAPSGRESWNMTAGEALAHGIPTITTDHSGVRENLGETATYLDADDLDGWIEAITSPAGTDVRERAQFNAERHKSDLTRFVEAVNSIGNDHAEAA